MSDVEYKDKGLKQLLKSMKGDLPQGRVGILGGGSRTEGKVSNAEIGAAHEYGTSILPKRSFLREPIADHLSKKMEQAGAFDELALKEVIRTGKLTEWVSKITILAEGIVLEAFATSGFGKWKESDMTHKKVHQTLIESQQLRNSITSEVK